MTWADFKELVVAFSGACVWGAGLLAWTCCYIFLLYKICGWLYDAGEHLYHG